MIPTVITDFATRLWKSVPRGATKLFELLEQTANLQGDIVDIGCGTCRSSIFIQYCLHHLGLTNVKKNLYLYDAFPVRSIAGNPCKPSDVDASPCDFERGKRIVEASFSEFNLVPPQIVYGWLSKSLENYLPEAISLAHISVPFHQSVLDSLIAVYSRLNGVCVLDSHGIGFTPCVEKATTSFLVNKPNKLEITPNAGQAFFWHRSCIAATTVVGLQAVATFPVANNQFYDLLDDEKLQEKAKEKLGKKFRKSWEREKIIQELEKAEANV